MTINAAVELQWGDLERADLERADLERTDLERTDLERTDLERTDLERTDLERTDTIGTAETGKNADLVPLSASPLEKVGNLASVAGLVAPGEARRPCPFPNRIDGDAGATRVTPRDGSQSSGLSALDASSWNFTAAARQGMVIGRFSTRD